VSITGEGPQPRELPPVTAPGYVGELGLLHGIPRTATVQARTDSTLLRIDGPDFLAAVSASRPSPSLLSVAGTRMARTAGLATPKPGLPTVPADH
jgi:Cyclic nucleotide-binding domain